jgi:hypothetical protein
LWGDPLLAPLHLGLVIALLLVKQPDLLHVLGQGPGRDDRPLHQIDLGLDLVRRQLPVPHDPEALNAGLLVQDDGELETPFEDVGPDLDILEVAETVERLDVLAHHLGGVRVPHPALELEADSGLFDFAGPDDVDLGNEGLVLRPGPPGWSEDEETGAHEDGQPHAEQRRHRLSPKGTRVLGRNQTPGPALNNAGGPYHHPPSMPSTNCRGRTMPGYGADVGRMRL